MSEYINLGDVTYFGITLQHPSGGYLTNADETPRYFLYKNASDTELISANFTARAGLIGTYRGSGDITTGNGFAAGDYVEVHASGKVSGLVGRAIIKTFVVSDTYNVNVSTWSGVPVNSLNNGNPTVNIASLTGVPLATSINPTIQNAVWGAKLSNLNINDTTGSGLWRIGLKLIDSNTVQWSGHNLANTLTNTLQQAIFGAKLSSWTINNTVGSGLNKISQNIYYAGIKFVKDSTSPRDEYIVQWFRNSLPVSSGEVTNPALSVYKTSDGTALTQNRPMAVTSVYNGVLRYNEASNLAVSGEPYLAMASGTIDGSVRVWSNPIGLDYL